MFSGSKVPSGYAYIMEQSAGKGTQRIMGWGGQVSPVTDH